MGKAAEITAEGVSIYKHNGKGKVTLAYEKLTKMLLAVSKRNLGEKIKLSTYDDIFGTE